MERTPLPPSSPSSEEGRAWLGVLLADAPDGGVEIVEVLPESPATLSGLRAGDLVIEVSGRPAYDTKSLARVVREARPGFPLELLVLRDGAVRPVSLVPTRRPVHPRLPWFGRRGEGLDPADSAEDLVAGMRVSRTGPELRSYLGTTAEAGLLVTFVSPGSAAAEVGLRAGDLLLRASGRPLAEPRDLARAVEASAGRAVPVEVYRRGAEPSRFEVELRARAGPGPHERQARLRGIRAALSELRERLAAIEAELDRLAESP
jgi:serine protease Do